MPAVIVLSILLIAVLVLLYKNQQKIKTLETMLKEKPPEPSIKVTDLKTFTYSEAEKKFKRSDLSYARVLVVDDVPDHADVTANMLRKYNMQVDCVSSGREAVDLIAAGTPCYNAVFMDYMMPEMDGIEAAALINGIETDYAKKIPIIAITGIIAGNEKIFLENGFKGFLPKPISVKNLDIIVERWVRDKTREI